jgi:hypothetical protein
MTATEELIADMKLWSCSPRVPLKAQLVMLEAIGRLSSPPEATAGMPGELLRYANEVLNADRLARNGEAGWPASSSELRLAQGIVNFNASQLPQRGSS